MNIDNNNFKALLYKIYLISKSEGKNPLFIVDKLNLSKTNLNLLELYIKKMRFRRIYSVQKITNLKPNNGFYVFNEITKEYYLLKDINNLERNSELQKLQINLVSKQRMNTLLINQYNRELTNINLNRLKIR